MRRRTSVALATLAALSVGAPAAQAAREPLNAYRVAPTAANKATLAQQGYDLTEGDRGSYLEIFATARQAAALRREEDVRTKLVGRARKARSAQAPVPVGSDADYTVWKRYDRVPGDGKEQYLELYDRLEGLPIVKKVVLGQSVLGRDIVALKVTTNAKARTDDTRPAVLYNAMQHAREWLAGETCRRQLLYFTSNYGRDTEAGRIVTPLVDSRELWFLCMVNPDGYEYTFTPGNRLWRKNMADNNGDGIRGAAGDGVDLNRNHATNWGRDREGSSDNLASETYRGPTPDSEPETKAYKRLWDLVDFEFMKNDHTAAELLLYPFGFQKFTETVDNGIFEALAGTDAEPAIADKTFDPETETYEITGNRFDPDESAELYITNGDALDDAYTQKGILGFTPEGSEPDLENVSGFEFQDVEADVEAEFQRHRLFAIDLARSAEDPANPISHLGNTTRDFYVDTFADSYGDGQPVQADVKRSLGPVSLRYRVDGGPVRTVATAAAPGGEKYDNVPGVYYERVRGVVTGTAQGDEVEAWFTGGRRSSRHFTYTVRRDSDAKVLVMAAENDTAGVPAQEPGPNYLTYYTDALDTLGVPYEIYDVDRRGNRAPDPLGVLAHFDAVIWYTGDDELTRQPGQPPGTGAARLALEEQLAVRDFLNEGGKLLYTGKFAGTQYVSAYEFRNFGFPEPQESDDGEWCNKNGTDADPDTEGIQGWPEFDEDDPTQADGCIPLDDDFLQYWLGAYISASPAGTFDEATGRPYPMLGRAGTPFEGLDWRFDETGANNQDHSTTFIPTSDILPPAQYPLFADSRIVADWLRPGSAPFAPFSGANYMSAGTDGRAYKRLGKVLDLTGATAPTLNFKVSADVEPEWDWVALEVRDVTTDPNSDAWTTLPEADTDGAGPDTSLTTQSTGESCPEGLASSSDAPHPFLQQYWGPDCSPTGTTPNPGEWHALTGNSGGWQDWTADLSAYAGKRVEVRIAYITDWGTEGLGVWVDDWRLSDGATQLEFQDFEQPLDESWLIGPPPEGSDPSATTWTRRGQEFTEGGVVATTDTVYTGFGFEGINESSRAAFLARTLGHLGVLPPAAVSEAGGGGAAGGGVAGETVSSKAKRGWAKLKAGKTLRIRGGKVRVRMTCGGDAGAACKGTLKIRRGKVTLGSKRVTLAAGRTATVTVRLRAKALARMKRGKALRGRVVFTGTDTSGARINALQVVRLKR